MDKSLVIYKESYGSDGAVSKEEMDYKLTSYRLSATRMGTAPTISGTIKSYEPIYFPNNGIMYVIFKGCKYYLDSNQDVSYNQANYEYSCNVSFVHERKTLETTYFFDVPLSSDNGFPPNIFNSDFSFSGDIKDLVKRLNSSMGYSKLSNYVVSVDADVKSESAIYSASRLKIFDALKQGYDTYKIPFYFLWRRVSKGLLLFSNDITEIKENAFSNCPSMKSISIPNKVTNIGKSAFSGCTGELIINSKIVETTYTSSTYPSYYGWLKDAKFTKLYIGDNVTKIGEFVFRSYTSLTSVTIPDSVTMIGNSAFRGCSALTSVTIPDGVTTIGDYAFAYCSSLTSVYCKATTPPTGGTSMFSSNASGRKIYVPTESVEAYKSASGWSTYASYIEGYNYGADTQFNETVATNPNEITYESESQLTFNDPNSISNSTLIHSAYNYYRIIFGKSSGLIDTPLELGDNGTIVSVKDSSKIRDRITKITGTGSTQNIPYYYPNPTPKGFLSIGGASKDKYEITNLLKFCDAIGVDEELTVRSTNATIESVELSVKNGVLTGDDYYVKDRGWSIVFKNSIDSSKTYLVKLNIKETYGVYTTRSRIDLRLYGGVVSNAYIVLKEGDRAFFRTNVTYKDGYFYFPDPISSISYLKDVEYTTEVSFYVTSLKPYIRIQLAPAGFCSRIGLYDFVLIDVDAKQVQSFNDIKVSVKGTSDCELEIIPNLYVTKTGINISKYITDAILYNATDEDGVPYIGTYTQKGFTTPGEAITFGRISPGEYKLSFTASYLPDAIVSGGNVALSLDVGYSMYLMSEKNVYRAGDIGISIKDGESSSIGDVIKQTIEKRLPVSKKLLPYRYRESDWEDIWYSTDDEGTNYTPFDGREIEYIYEGEEIKPSIKGTRMSTNIFGDYLDQPLDVAFDDNDNDEIYPEDSDKAGEYKHPYFFVKLRQLINKTYIISPNVSTTKVNWKFNLFDSVLDGQEASLSFTSGHVAGCKFNIAMDEATGTFNPVQVDGNGNLVRDEEGNVIVKGIKIDSQQDTSSGSVWVALRKDINTMGTIMPSKQNGIYPTKEDKFVILGIDMPEALVKAAEQKLEKSIKTILREKNSIKKDFSVKLSSIYAEENDAFYSDLDENSQATLYFNSNEHKDLYISAYNVVMNENSALPEIEIQLTDEIKIVEASKEKTAKNISSLASSVSTLNREVNSIVVKNPLKIKPV